MGVMMSRLSTSKQNKGVVMMVGANQDTAEAAAPE